MSNSTEEMHQLVIDPAVPPGMPGRKKIISTKGAQELQPEKPTESDAPVSARTKKATPEKWGAGIQTRDGVASLASLDEQMRFASLLMQKGMVSPSFKDPGSVVLGIQYAKAMKLEPIVGLRMMYVLNGIPTLFGDGPLSLAWRSKLLTSAEEFWIDENGERISQANKNLKARPFGSVTRLWRKDDPLVQEDFFTKDDLAIAGIDIGPKGKKVVWSKYERLMMRYKARTIALKSKCTDLMNGVPVAEYDFNFNPDLPDVTEHIPATAQIAERAKGAGQDLNQFLEAQATEVAHA